MTGLAEGLVLFRGTLSVGIGAYPFQSQTVLAYQPHSVLNASDFVESETSNAFDLRSPEDLFTDAADDLL